MKGTKHDLKSTEEQISKGGAMEILATVQSLKQARRTLDQLAIGWRAGEPGQWGVIYERGKHRLYIEKKVERQWQIVKSTAEAVAQGG